MQRKQVLNINIAHTEIMSQSLMDVLTGVKQLHHMGKILDCKYLHLKKKDKLSHLHFFFFLNYMIMEALEIERQRLPL